ncbi:hypothetical protein NPX13_g2478 [Xylaria arbuscula]|uniref:Uncharacterized protein n=1 Tax=Xylaria arbuscula TaxID=114810 RepID=A0A9W8TP52_9PEZI|nr:hypothetical protein NPX13_g2478 [Xylaria arbuscula]
MAQVFTAFPFLEADGLSTDWLFEPVHPIAPDSPETFSPPSEGIYDLEAFFEFEAATQAETVEDQPVLGAGSTAIDMCSDFPASTHGSPPVEMGSFLTGIGAGADDGLDTYPPTFLAEPPSSTKSDSLQATAIGPPPATPHVNIGYCTPDTSSGKNSWEVDGKAVGYGNAGGNACPRLAGALQAAPEADGPALRDLEPNIENPIQSIPVGLDTAPRTGKGPCRKSRRSCVRPVGIQKTKGRNVRRPDARANRREHHAIARLDNVFFPKLDNIEARSYRWIRRADKWKVEPRIDDLDLMSLFRIHQGAPVVSVRPESGDLIRIEWDQDRLEFVCADIPGRRLYLVSAEKIEYLLSNPGQGVKLNYWLYTSP